MVPQSGSELLANLNPRFSSRFKKLQNSVNLAEPVQTDLNISLRVAELNCGETCPHFSLKNRALVHKILSEVESHSEGVGSLYPKWPDL
jgi:hypothetical protein